MWPQTEIPDLHQLERLSLKEVMRPDNDQSFQRHCFTAVSDNTRPALSKTFQDLGFFCDVNQIVTVASTVFVK